MREWFAKHGRLLTALLLTAAFIVAEAYALWYRGNAMVALVPVALLAVWLLVTRLETALLVMALLTPFAINMALLPGMELSMPVEPLMILFSAIFLFRVLAERDYDRRLLRHPVTLLVTASLVWMAVTSATSELPWVSAKYTLARLWFVLPFFYASAQIFRNQRRISQFFWAYAIGLGVVILIATSKTLGNFSDLQTLHRVMKPFYNDHTAYGCAIALMLPAAVYFCAVGTGACLTPHGAALHRPLLLLLPRGVDQRGGCHRGLCADPYRHESQVDDPALRAGGGRLFRLPGRGALQP